MRTPNGGHARAQYRHGALASPEYDPEMMPQTTALRTYRLSLQDLAPLKFTKALNPMDPSYAPMKLYRVADLKRVCDAKYASKGGLDAYREHLAERKQELDAAKAEKEVAKALRAGELVRLLTDAGVSERERAVLLKEPCAVSFIKRARSKATAEDIVAELLALRGPVLAAAGPVAPVMSTPAKAAPPRAPAASPASGVKHERDPEVVYLL